MSTSALSISKSASACGLELPDGLTYQAWLEVGHTFGRVERSYRWWVGDWLNYGEAQYGDMYTQALAETSLDIQSLWHCKSVACSIEFCRRRQNLSWSHHLEVANLPPDEQDEWLARAEENHWTRQQLRQWLKGPKQLPEPGSREIESVPLLRFCQPDLPAATIVSLILRVAFPDALTALDATYGSGAFWDGSAHVSVTGVDIDPTRAPDGAADFRDLIYDDDSFDVVIFDPPHLADAGSDSIMRARYGTYADADLESAIRDGCREVWRVARLGVVVKVTDHIHGQRFITETDWVRDAIPQQLYDVVHQTRTGGLVDPKWEDQLSAYNNGSSYLIFRKDSVLHIARGGRTDVRARAV